MREQRITFLGRSIGLVVTLLLLGVPALAGQVPSKIPSDPEAQIFDLIKRVTALEEKLASLTNGTASLRVRAPFVVTDAAGEAVLQVTNGKVPLGKDGVVIARDPGSDIGAIVLYDDAGREMVNLVQLPTKGGGIVLGDAKGVQRAELTGDGQFALSDESGKDYVILADEVSKEEADILIGGDDGRYAVEVGGGSGKGSAVLGTDEDGVGVLALSDEQDRERAVLDGGGRLEISDDAGRDILSVASEVIEKDAGVAISLTEGAGQLRVTDKSGKPAAGILGDTRSVVVVNSTGKVTGEMLTSESGDGLFQAWGEGKVPSRRAGTGVGKGGWDRAGLQRPVNGGEHAGRRGGRRADPAQRHRWDAGRRSRHHDQWTGDRQGGSPIQCGPNSNAGLAAGALGVAAQALLPDCLVGLP